MTTSIDTRPSVPAHPHPGIPFRSIVAVEWRKATDTRSARWLLGLCAVGALALVLIPLLAHTDIRRSFAAYLVFPAQAVVTLLPVVAVLAFTSEWGQRSALITFVQEPRRWRVIVGKLVVTVGLGISGAVFALAVAVLAAGVAGLGGRSLVGDLSAAGFTGTVLLVLVEVLIGAALGAALPNSAAAVAAFLGLPLIAIFVGADVSTVEHWLSPSTAIAGWVATGDYAGHVPQILVCFAVWVAVPVAIGLRRTARRDIG